MNSVDGMIINSTLPATSTNEYSFYHYTPKYDSFYHVTCKVILHGAVMDNHDYDHGFFYENSAVDYKMYYVACKYIPHSLIIRLLNKEVRTDYGNLDRQEILSLNQKLEIENELKQILPSHLMKHSITERAEYNYDINYAHSNMQATAQTNYDHSLSHINKQDINGIGDYTHVTNPQQQIHFNNTSQQFPEREMRLDPNNNISSFHENIAMVTPTDINNGLHHQNGMGDFQQYQIPENDRQGINGDYTDYTHISYSQQQVETDNFPQYHLIENNGNIGHNVAMTDVNQIYDDNNLPLNSNFPQHIPETRIDYNNTFDENTGNNLIITQAASDENYHERPCNIHS
ncbi:unnamed protein product [Rhizophagus irregularis]|uniref:Uncharacterized protein n=1 Tax=Rhizophagus irregularis TaxID=588596 RepID=A0A2I1G8Z5_9GLOM|nr:hypothetical protein RhiirA4_508531 [Rhizophagus irregularis]CAB4443986.1 unnamed protein product [Rhizophagus irregularis]